jgi:hypothetical protein
MITLDVRLDVKDAEQYLSRLERNAARRAAARAINDTLTTLRAEGARLIKASHPALRIGDIKANMIMKRAGYSELRGLLSTTGKPLSALLFKVRGGQRKSKGLVPVTAQFGIQRTVLGIGTRAAFRIAKFGDEVFVRRSDNSRRVRRLRGPSLPGVFRAQTVKFQQLARERWAITFPNRLRYEIEAAKGGGAG